MECGELAFRKGGLAKALRRSIDMAEVDDLRSQLRLVFATGSQSE